LRVVYAGCSCCLLIIYVRGVGEFKELLDNKEGGRGSIRTGLPSAETPRQRYLRHEEGEDYRDEGEVKRKCA
jgi:hypothetical protein